MVLALLVSMLALAIGGVLFTSIAVSQRTSRQGRDFTTALETADAGVQHALAQLNGGTAPTPPATPLEVGDATVTYTAVPSVGASGADAWEITATATSLLTGEQRRVVSRVEEEPRFPFAMFTDDSLSFIGGNVLNSYSSGVLCTPLPSCAWSSPYSGAGIPATNSSLSFNGNATADGTTLYDWAANPSGTRCTQSGGGTTPNPCATITYKNERLDLTTANEIEFVEDMEDACTARYGATWPDWTAGQGAAVPRVLTPDLQTVSCYHNLIFDVDTILAPLTQSLDIQPVIAVIQRGGSVIVEGGINVNCLAPCSSATSVPAAPHLQIYTLATGNVFTMKQHANFAGVVYAPLGGCGGDTSNAQADIYGALVCDRASSVGGWQLHYDRALAGVGNGRFLVREWREEPV